MEAQDFRSIGREALRRRAIVLVEQDGISQGEVARAVGVQRQTINIWLKRYHERGEGGLLDGRRVSGRKGKGALTARPRSMTGLLLFEVASDVQHQPQWANLVCYGL